VATITQCPHCAAPLKAGDIVCLKCGLNLLTGQHIAQARPEVKVRRSVPWLKIAGIAAGVAVLAAAGGGIYYVLSRDVVGSARTIALEGRSLEAIGRLQEHLKSHPDDQAAQVLLGQVYFDTQDFTSALSTLEGVSLSDEASARLAVVAAGKLPGDSGRQRQIGALRRLVEARADNAIYWLWLGMAQSAAGDAPNAIAAFDRVLELEPANAQARLHRGVARAMNNDLQNAADDLLAAGAAGAAPLAAVEALRGGTVQAETLLAQRVASADDPMARARLGALYLGSGRYEDALQLLQPSPGVTPNPTVQYLYALALRASGLDLEAQGVFQAVADAKGPAAEAAAAQIAGLYLDQGDLPRANEYARRAATSGRTVSLITLEGRIRLAEGEAEQANRLFREAIAMDPTYAPAQLEAGLYEVAMGNIPAGVELLDRFLVAARAAGGSPRLNEIELLVSQLRQTIEGGASEASVLEASAS
jgi:tetratricopeptide (TPR) repeat protein